MYPRNWCWKFNQKSVLTVLGGGPFWEVIRIRQVGSLWWHYWLYKKRKRGLRWRASSSCVHLSNAIMQWKGPYQVPRRCFISFLDFLVSITPSQINFHRCKLLSLKYFKIVIFPFFPLVFIPTYLPVHVAKNFYNQ